MPTRATLLVLLLASALAAIIPTIATGTDLYVDADNGSDVTGDGRVVNPWKTITHALLSVSGSQEDPATIHVAPGTYAASTNGEAFPLTMQSWVSLLGAGAETTILDGEEAAFHVICCNGAANFTIEAVTIRGGLANGEDSDGGGAGIYCFDSSPTIKSCTITNNQANECGAGLYSKSTWPTVISSPTIISCMITHNSATLTESGTGGGIFSMQASPTIQDCTIAGNSASYTGGGIYCEDAVGTIKDCVITENTAQWGGGICWFSGSLTISNCAFNENSASKTGGGLWCEDSFSQILNCTVSGNSAVEDGGGIFLRTRYPDRTNRAITDGIFWGNGSNVWVDATVSYCDIEGMMPLGEGNISDDPLFVTGPLGDYYLSCQAAGQAADSPCIDAGSDSAEALGLDQLTTRTDGVPDAGTVDMGYHYAPALAQNPQIECSLNQTWFSPTELLVASLEAQNQGPAAVVDVYVGLILPDGSILCYTGDNFEWGTVPWLAGITLPQGFHFGPKPIFKLTIPGYATAGSYIYAAALTKPGLFEFTGEPSLFPFTITD